MQPRTKKQIEVVDLSNRLQPLTATEENWAFKHCLFHQAFRTKKEVACLDCGHVWPSIAKVKAVVCPNCMNRLTVKDTRRTKDSQLEYASKLETHDGFQVIRIFQITGDYRVGRAAKLSTYEVSRQFLKPGEKPEVVSRVKSFGYYNGDHFSGGLEIRNREGIRNKYDAVPYRVFPKPQVLPIYRRNGFRHSAHGCSVYELFTALEVSPRAETLLKAGQYPLLRAKVGNSHIGGRIDRYWSSIRICIRNNYSIKHPGDWFDYLDILSYYGKDLNNPKYVCPDKFSEAHDYWVSKKSRDDEKRRAEAERRRAVEELRRETEDNKRYQKRVSAFIGIAFTKGPIKVKLLESVQDFIDEAEAHKHCVAANKYYNRPESLVFSAKIGGKPIETVEVSLKDMKVVQSRGKHNSPSPHHEEIVTLVNSNIHVIRKIFQQQKRGTA